MKEKTTPTKSWKRRLLGWTLEALLVISIIFLVHSWQTRDSVTGKAPALSGTTLAGTTFDLENLRGKPVIVHFWASWCPICRLESGVIEGLVGDYPLITIAMQSGDEGEILAYLAENELSFPVISDPDGRLAATWGVRGVPTTFLIDAAGEIQFVEVGYTTSLGIRARIWFMD